MNVEITVDMRKLNDIIRELPDRAEEFIKGLAFEMERDLKQSFGTSPSAPGEPPGVDTGNLRASVRTEKTNDPLTWLVKEGGGNVSYAGFLEYGTRKMAARPHFLPAAERTARAVSRNAGKVVGDG